MTYQEANHISIKDYLKSLGILPAVDKYYYACTTVRSVRMIRPVSRWITV